MLLVIDIGNTRTKWSVVDEQGRLKQTQACMNADLEKSKLQDVFADVSKVLIANVAGNGLASIINSIIPSSIETAFVISQSQACGLNNGYEPAQSLGVDRWLAAIAVWHMQKPPAVIINAGTAVTIDTIIYTKNKQTGKFVGGTIMPGLQLMQTALTNKAANLKDKKTGYSTPFPTNTQDAMATGCLNAIVGAIILFIKQLEQQHPCAPKIILSGGDASKVAEALRFHAKHVIIAENLVLHGLVILEKEF